MPFLDHLEELRRRLFNCAVAIAVGGLVAWALFVLVPMYHPGWDPISFLQGPIRPYLHGEKLKQFHPGEAFKVMLNVGFWIALTVASPVILLQLWKFVAPALYEHEKKIALPVVLSMVLLFVTGVIIAYVFVMPLSAGWLIGIGEEYVDPEINVTSYMDFLMFTCIGFGLVFELPIAMLGLGAIGIAKSSFLRKYRRHGIVICLFASASITPDPTTMFMMAIPIYLLFEASILLVAWVERVRKRREEAESQEEPDSAMAEAVPHRGVPRRLDELE